MGGVNGGTTRSPRLGDVVTRLATGCLGAGMILLPAPHLTGRSRVLVALGLVLVAVSLAGPLARWRIVGTLAAATAVTEAALTRPDLAVLAWEGLLILGYLLLVDAPRRMPGIMTAHWLWRHLPLAVWGVFTAAIVLVVLAVRVPVSAWLLVAGAGAAVAAVVIALPRRPAEPRKPR
jgi:hypothetical protein